MSFASEGADLSKPLDLAQPSLAGVEDYIALLKPRVMSLVVFTALVGLLVAPVHIHPVIGFTALLCIAIGAGASGALNMWYDADIDAVMTRTARRPIPAGRVQPGEALAFGVMLAGFSVAVFGLLVNWVAAALLGIPMLPVVAGPDETRKQILIYSLVLAPVGLSPTLFGFAGLTYCAFALICGAAMVALAWRVYRERTGPAAATAARRLFAFSLIYVFVLFAALLADNLLARLGFAP